MRKLYLIQRIVNKRFHCTRTIYFQKRTVRPAENTKDKSDIVSSPFEVYEKQ